ncbi:MAG: hypothetical protein AVDCRST_MAG50-101 [uncultured Acidimicrobiales bacterium]|uniref:Uncharacterized protein n=1 Tax=uncultured Acidimicrobiales bacterium TaxID=310071 RepID=A0A6J4H4I7_9ACTN|nr:MAG: hypothetical protein AVDCRST_MAG50-101 [uncultured Acidimicrobiales bacterium]
MSDQTGNIKRSDIESKLREIQGEVDTAASSAKPIGMAVVAAGAVALLVVAYLLGSRKGKKKSTVVEIRRV